MQTLVKFKQFVDEILAETGRNYKISVLEKYKDDEDIKYYLDFIYNPYIITGISTKSYQRFHSDSCIDVYPENIFNSTKEALEYLKVHNTGDNATREYMFSYYIKVHLYEIKLLIETKQSVDLHELFYCIITKNIQLGIDSKTINKVIPGLIPEFNVQLSNKDFDKPEIVKGKEFVITTKIDGSRIIAMKDNGQVSFWTRQGQKYEGLVDLEHELKEYFPDNIVLDGEIVAIDTDKENTYKNTMKLSRTKDLEKHGLKMLVFDCLDINEFKAQHCDYPYYERRRSLEEVFSSAALSKDWELRKQGKCLLMSDKFPEFFELLPILYQGKDTSKILEILDEQVAEGEEGIMINLSNGKYEFKRSNNLLKVKKFQDTEVEIIGFEEGTNKLAGTLGAFICKYKGNEVRVGSGLTDADRAYFWANRTKFLGKFITVKYFETSVDSKTGLESLRFPIYLRVREDI